MNKLNKLDSKMLIMIVSLSRNVDAQSVKTKLKERNFDVYLHAKNQLHF